MVGYVEGEEYHTSRKRKEHFFRKYRGWALSLDVLAQIEGLGGKRTVFEIEGERSIVAELKDWEGGVYYDNGGDLQVILRETEFDFW